MISHVLRQGINGMNPDPQPGLAARMARLLSKIEPNEMRAVVSSFSLVLILMAAYYILRPVRDAMASDWSDAEVSLLWTINFFFSFVVVAGYGAAASRIRDRKSTRLNSSHSQQSRMPSSA